MARHIRVGERRGKLMLKFMVNGVEFYKTWGDATNETHRAKMRYIASEIAADINTGQFTDLTPYFKDAEIWDWRRLLAKLNGRAKNSTNVSLASKLERDRPRLNGPEHVRNWLDSMGLANATKARYLGAIKAICSPLCEGISYSAKTMSEPSPFTQQEQIDICSAAKKLNIETYTLLMLWMCCGFRPGEVRALKVTDIHLDLGLITIKRSMTTTGVLKKTKNCKQRIIKVGPDLTALLGDYIVLAGESEYLFPSVRHHSNWVRRVWHPLLASAGITEDLRPYRLRHTAITMAVQKNPAAIARIAKAYGTSPAVIFDHYLGYVSEV